MKTVRQQRILELIQMHDIEKQEELVQMLYNYLGDEEEGRVPAAAFTDTGKLSGEQAEYAFAWALEAKIVSEKQTALRPADLVTKAEAATMLTNSNK